MTMADTFSAMTAEQQLRADHEPYIRISALSAAASKRARSASCHGPMSARAWPWVAGKRRGRRCPACIGA